MPSNLHVFEKDAGYFVDQKGDKHMSEYFKTWIKAAAIRALKTVAQTAAATIGTSAAISEVNWVLVASSAVTAGILSILTSLAGLPECKDCAEGVEHTHDTDEWTDDV